MLAFSTTVMDGENMFPSLLLSFPSVLCIFSWMLLEPLTVVYYRLLMNSHRRMIPPSPCALPASSPKERPFPSKPNSAPASPLPPAASAYGRLMLAARQHIGHPGPTAFPPSTAGYQPRQTGSFTSCAEKCAPS